MSSQRTHVSEGLARQIGRMAEDSALKYPGGTAQAELAKGNSNFGDYFHKMLDNLASEMAGSTGIGTVEDLALLLERQVGRLLEIGAVAEAKVAEGKYRDQLMAAVAAFAWREDLASIGLNRVALVDFRLRGKFLAEAGGVNEYIEADRCTLYKGVTLPDGVLVIQGQWGVKYRSKTPRWSRENFNPLEQGLTVKERLTVHLYEGEALLRECYTDLPGSVSPFGDVPFLFLWRGRSGLGGCSGASAGPVCGSGSRGK